MKKLIPLFLGALVLLLVQACQNQRSISNAIVRDNQDGLVFIKNGIEGNLTIVKASGLVITNSNNHQVIGFAKLMLDDHTNTDSGLMKIETNKLMEANDTINAIHQQLIGELSKKSGPAFDKAYMQMMVADHEATVQLFTKASNNPDAEISKFASSTLPVIKLHLDSARSVLGTLK